MKLFIFALLIPLTVQAQPVKRKSQTEFRQKLGLRRATPRSVEGFDIRRIPPQLSGVKSDTARALVDQRRAAVAERAASDAGLEIKLNLFGLPRVMWKGEGALTPPSDRDPVTIAREFLLKRQALFGLPADGLDNLRLLGQGDSGAIRR